MSDSTNSGPCVVCGATNYLPSLGGPEICPPCDCGDFGHVAVQRQRATIEDLSRKLEEAQKRAAFLDQAYDGLMIATNKIGDECAAKDARIAELERELTKFHAAQPLRGREMWAIWNSCNGVFDVTNWRKDALDVIAEAYSEHETVVPVRVLVEPEDDHDLRHAHEDEREAAHRAMIEAEKE